MQKSAVLPEDQYFHTLSESEIWQRYCGFLDLSLDEFMAIQERLLMEQIDLVYSSPLGRKIVGNQKPKDVQEFRQLVPLTTYKDYEPFLDEQREDALAEKPYFWAHTSGRGGYFKWVPYTEKGFDALTRCGLGTLILSTAKSKGEVNIKPGQRVLLLIPPRPYITGSANYYMSTSRFSMNIIPPSDIADTLEFQDRVSLGFTTALRTGVDIVFSIGSILAKVGEMMASQASGMKVSRSLMHPAVLTRLISAWLRSKRLGRGMLPGDLWQAKAIITGGTDAQIYKSNIARYWGQVPYECYGATEVLFIAMQAWNKRWLTFTPEMAFWELIPDTERRKAFDNPGYRPATVLLNEVKPGQDYEVVLTHFHGMPLLRYRIGDVIRVTAPEDEEAGIKLPQIVFKSRIGDEIGLFGLTMLDERTVWQAIVNTGIEFEDWSAHKQIEDNQTCLRIYLEPKGRFETDHMEQVIDSQLRAIDIDYRDIGDHLGLRPVRVTPLSPGTFQRYYEEKRKEGADLAHLKPPHMNPPADIVALLLKLSQQG